MQVRKRAAKKNKMDLVKSRIAPMVRVWRDGPKPRGKMHATRMASRRWALFLKKEVPRVVWEIGSYLR